jgi:hypothetical protein
VEKRGQSARSYGGPTGRGRLHLFWDTLDGPGFIYHAMQTERGWTEPAPVAPSNGTSYTLYEPYVDANGAIHLLWRNWLGSGIEKPQRLLYASFDGDVWSTEEQVASFDYELQGMVHGGEGGVIHVTYVWGMISSHESHTTRSASGWSAPVELKPAHTISLVWVDRQGGVHLYGSDYSNNRVRYSYWKSGTFPVSERVMEGRVYGRRSLLDGLNNLHLYWSGTVPVPGGQVSGLYHQCVEDNRVFGPQEIPSGGEAQGISGKAKPAL